MQNTQSQRIEDCATILIRQAHPDDALSVYRILCSAKEKIPIISPRFEKEDGLKWVIERCQNQRVWIAKSDTEIVGAMIIKIDMMMKFEEIHYLAVSEQYQGKGIGSKLVAKAKRMYPNLMVEVWEENANAIRLFIEADFEYIGKKPPPTIKKWNIYFWSKQALQ